MAVHPQMVHILFHLNVERIVRSWKLLLCVWIERVAITFSFIKKYQMQIMEEKKKFTQYAMQYLFVFFFHFGSCGTIGMQDIQLADERNEKINSTLPFTELMYETIWSWDCNLFHSV